MTTTTGAARVADRERLRGAARAGVRQEWRVTFFEVDEAGERKTGGAEVAHTRYVTASPLASAIVVGHTVFHALCRHPEVPEVYMSDYAIERTRLVTAEAGDFPVADVLRLRRRGSALNYLSLRKPQ